MINDKRYPIDALNVIAKAIDKANKDFKYPADALNEIANDLSSNDKTIIVDDIDEYIAEKKTDIDQYVTEKESQIDDYVDEVIESIPSDYTGLVEEVSDLTSFVKKDASYEKTSTLAVTSGGLSHSTTVITCSIPSGQSYQFTLNVTAERGGNISVYANYSDGTFTAKSYNYTNGATVTWTDAKDIIEFDVNVASGVTSDGNVITTVSYERQSVNSLEERCDNLENAVESVASGKVSTDEMVYTNLKHVNASANRLDESALVTGKQVNYYSGAISDSAAKAIAYLDVQPEDVIYIWRYHNHIVMSGNVNGIATYKADGSFVRLGVGGDQHTFTVPADVYKLGMNVYYSQIQDGDHFMIIVNDSTQPAGYEPFTNEYSAYEAKEKFLEAVDFNTLLPTALKSPETGFIESYGHMGLSAYYPGNTHLSIIGAKKAGLGGVEMDLQITSDNVIVLYHDETLQRVGGTSSDTIANHTLAQLADYDFGSWFDPKFTGTPVCTFDKATQLCRELGLKMYLDCKHVTSVANIQLAESILEKWGMEDNAIWVMGTFVNIWTALPNAKVMFPAGSKLTGSQWTDPTLGWFKAFNGNFPEDKKAYDEHGMPIVPDGVWFGISQDYEFMNDASYGIEGLYTESELARERNIKYGFYAVDDYEDIAELSEGVPYQQYMASNAISYQNAMNKYYEISKADYSIE